MTKKLRFCLLNDLHLEFAPFEWPDPSTFDVLILAGDIRPFSHEPSLENLKQLEKYEDKTILYVAGNHEFYKNEDIRYPMHVGWCMSGYHSNNMLVLGDTHYLHMSDEPDKTYHIFGGTMWTDFNNENPLDMEKARLRMNDYRYINQGQDEDGKYYKLNPSHTVALNKQFKKDLLENFLRHEVDGPRIVITHHSPFQSESDKYNHGHNNPAYHATWCRDVMNDHRIDVWCHGHTHEFRDEVYRGKADTRILSNARGYAGKEWINGFKPGGLIFEL